MRCRIVETDNFGGDYPNEKFVNVPTTTRENAQKIADAINAVFCPDGGPHAHRFWKVVEDGYRLHPGFEP